MLRSKLSRLLLNSCRYSASASARCCVVGGQQFDAQLCLTQAAGGIEPRGQRETDVFAIERRFLIDLGELHQRRQPGRRALLQTLQTVMHQDAVFIDQRHDVGHGADRRQSDGLQQERPHGFADFFRLASALAKCPGQFESHAGAAQTGERILMAGQARMNNRRGLRQFGRHFVMIGNDQFQAQFAGRHALLANWRCRNRR